MKHYLFSFIAVIILAILLAIAFYPVVNEPITLPIQKTVNMRYFFVAYTSEGGNGMYLLNRTDFPSLDSLRINIGNKNNSNKDRVFITEIYEFKNEADFNNFIK